MEQDGTRCCGADKCRYCSGGELKEPTPACTFPFLLTPHLSTTSILLHVEYILTCLVGPAFSKSRPQTRLCNR